MEQQADEQEQDSDDSDLDDSQSEDLEQQSDEQEQDSDDSDLDDSQSEDLEQQSDEQGQGSDNSDLDDSQSEDLEQLSDEQGQDSDDSDLDDSQGEDSEQQSDEQEQDSDDSEMNDSQGESSEQQSDEQNQESDNQEMRGSRSSNLEEQSDEQGQESDNRNGENSQGVSPEQQSNKQSQESDNQAIGDSQGGDLEQHSDEQGQASDNQNMDDSRGGDLEQHSDEQGQAFDNQNMDDSRGGDLEQHSDEQGQAFDNQNMDDSRGGDLEQQSDEQGQESDNPEMDGSMYGDLKEQPDEHVQDSDSQNMDDSQDEEEANENLQKLQNLKNVLQKYADRKRQEESQKEKQPPTEISNQFLEQLNELPPFSERLSGGGYAIDTSGNTEIPDSLIRTLIVKFLNQRFCRHSTDLNVRAGDLEKTNGFYKWEVRDVTVHFKTHQLNKLLHDKYTYDYSSEKNDHVPLSFYFDMSGSMSNYTNMLAVVAIELLKKDVKVLVGFNETVHVQIERIQNNMDVLELANILTEIGSHYVSSSIGMSSLRKDSRISFKLVYQDLDDYLLKKKAEKAVMFADFDPRGAIIHLSQKCQVYWFCFEKNIENRDFTYGNQQFQGFVYQVQSALDIAEGLAKVNERRFENLCFIDNPKTLRRSK